MNKPPNIGKPSKHKIMKKFNGFIVLKILLSLSKNAVRNLDLNFKNGGLSIESKIRSNIPLQKINPIRKIKGFNTRHVIISNRVALSWCDKI